MMSIHTGANAHNSDWLMSVFINEIAKIALCTQPSWSKHAAVPKNYERDNTK